MIWFCDPEWSNSRSHFKPLYLRKELRHLLLTSNRKWYMMSPPTLSWVWPSRLSSNQLITPVTEMLVPRWHHIVCMNSRHINISMPCSEIDSTLRSRTRSIKHTNNIYWNLFKFDVRCVNGISFKLVYVLSPKHNPNVMALLNTSLQSRPIWAFCFHNPMICGDTRTLNSSQNNTSRINFMSK